ncbi:MAG: DUF6152 family protein [Acidobacteriota bacterium]
MKPSAQTTLVAASAVAALLLSFPATSPAQNQINVTSNNGPDDVFHAFEKYNDKAPITVAGVVTRLNWTNPHVYIYIDAKDASGTVTNWSVEGYPPNTLKRGGFPSEAIKTGDMVTISAFQAKDGSNTSGGYEITLADGSKKIMGPLGK